LENVGLVAVLGVIAAIWGTGIAIDQVTPAEAALLGAGSTLAVALNALAQMAGARRLGVRLWPRAGWRDAEVRGLARIAGPSSAIAGMNSTGLFALMVASGQVPGGAVAFQIACNLFNLPIA